LIITETEPRKPRAFEGGDELAFLVWEERPTLDSSKKKKQIRDNIDLYRLIAENRYGSMRASGAKEECTRDDAIHL
jgi:hypothetical protein